MLAFFLLFYMCDLQALHVFYKTTIFYIDIYSFFTARRNDRIASAVLATAILSVCPSVRPSVTRRYCVKTTARNTVAGDSSVPLISERKGTEHHCKHLHYTHFASYRGSRDVIVSLACVRLTGWPVA